MGSDLPDRYPKPANLLPAEQQQAVPEHLEDEVRDALKQARAPNTQLAYSGDLRRFESWCKGEGRTAIPASAGTLAGYVAWLAQTGWDHPACYGTIQRALSAISQAHLLAGHPSPRSFPGVREVMKGLRRKLGTAPEQKREIMRQELLAMVEATKGDSLRARRDRALLLLGWSCALRRSELVALEASDLEWVGEDGLRVTIGRSKTDQEQAGTELGIPSSSVATLLAVRAWLEASEITSGPLFRRCRGGLAQDPLKHGEVARIVKRALRKAGMEPAEFAGHSLRAGFATQASRDGVPLETIMVHTRHKDVETALRYVRRGALFTNSAAKGVAP